MGEDDLKTNNNDLVRKAVRLALTSSIMASSFAMSAYAEEANSEAEAERIEVTGSRIKRIDVETAVPVQVFDSEFIDATGASTLQDFLFQSNLAGPGIFNENETLNQQAGISTFDARGFGESYTVILLNGRRLANNPQGGTSATNLNLIPLGAIERVEFLSDGASAIYGADAIAGVVNIITKQDYEGAKVELRHNRVESGDQGEFTDFSLTIGSSGDKGSTLFSFNYSTQDNLDAADLPLIGSAVAPDGTDGRSPTGLPGTFADLANDISYPAPGCPEGSARTAQFTTNGQDCAYDFAPLYQAIPAQTRQSILALGDYDVTDDLNIFGEFRFSRNVTEVRNGAAPAFFDVTESPSLAAIDAQLGTDLANSDEVFILRRFVDAGPRATDNTNTAFSSVVGLNYAFNENHEMEFSVQTVESEQNRVGVGGQLSTSRIEAAVADGTFDPTQTYSPEFFEENGLAISTQRQAVGKEDTLQLGFTGFIPSIGDGDDLGYAIGAQYQENSFNDRADVASTEGDVAGGASSNGAGENEITSFYGELSYTPIEGLELSLAARNDKYDWTNGVTSGDAQESTYKFSVGYRPIDQLLLRASVGTGFKAPTLGELFLGRSFGVTTAVDTTTCNAVTNAAGSTQAEIDAACRNLEIRSASGGNPDLEAETSDSYSFGVVFEPIEDLNITIDYYNIQVDNIIGSLTVQEIIDNEADFPDLVTRVNGSLSQPGAEVQSDLQNLTQENGEGIDVTSRYSMNTDFGLLGFDLRAAYLISHERQLSAIQPLCEDAGTTSEPEIRLNGQFNWSQEDWASGLNFRYIGSTEDLPGGRDTANNSCDPSQEFQDVDSYLEFGAYVSYTAPIGSVITFGVRNLTDEEPPFSTEAGGGWPWFDQALYDVRGRNYYLNLSHEF